VCVLLVEEVVARMKFVETRGATAAHDSIWDNLHDFTQRSVRARALSKTLLLGPVAAETREYLKSVAGEITKEQEDTLMQCLNDGTGEPLKIWLTAIKEEVSASSKKTFCTYAYEYYVRNCRPSINPIIENMTELYDSYKEEPHRLIAPWYARLALVVVFLVVVYLIYTHPFSDISAAAVSRALEPVGVLVTNIYLPTHSPLYGMIGKGSVDQVNEVNKKFSDRQLLAEIGDNLTAIAVQLRVRNSVKRPVTNETRRDLESLEARVSVLETQHDSRMTYTRDKTENVVSPRVDQVCVGEDAAIREDNTTFMIGGERAVTSRNKATSPSKHSSPRRLDPVGSRSVSSIRDFNRLRYSPGMHTRAGGVMVTVLLARIKDLSTRITNMEDQLAKETARIEEEHRLKAARIEEEHRLEAARMEAEHREATRRYKERVQLVFSAIGGIIILGMVGPAVAPYVIPVGSVAASCIFSGPWYDAGVTMSRTLGLIFDISFIRCSTDTMHFIWRNHESFI